jgi:hypothetical protein
MRQKVSTTTWKGSITVKTTITIQDIRAVEDEDSVSSHQPIMPRRDQVPDVSRIILEPQEAFFASC